MNLYNSMSYNAEHMQVLHDDIENCVAQDGYSRDYVVGNNELSAAILQLKPNKNLGSNSLSTNHFKHAGADLSVHIACLFWAADSWHGAERFFNQHCHSDSEGT